MAVSTSIPEPSRSTEVARLELVQFAKDAPLDKVFHRACELSAEALHVERVSVWLFLDDHSVLRCSNLYERSRNEHSRGAVLHAADFPRYFDALKIRKALPAEVAATEPWAAELAATYLLPLGITSILNAGIFSDGALIGVVCHEHVGPPREWTTEARDFAGSVADLLAGRIQSAEVRELRAAFLMQQRRLADQDKIAALSRLASGVAHDFRNLLTVFLCTGESLCQRSDLPPSVRADARTIVAAAERGMALATDLAEFARPGERPPTVMDLADATAELLPMLRKIVGARHTLEMSRAVAIGNVLFDKTQYTRLLLNLVVNAREAMPKGGVIGIRLTSVKLSKNRSYSGPFVLLEVTDRGCGMDEATRQRVFEPFFTTKAKGTGLGLAIVKQIVERAGGRIRIESEPEQGTTFRVLIPRIGTKKGGSYELTLTKELREPVSI